MNKAYNVIKNICKVQRVTYISKKIANSWLLITIFLLVAATALSISFAFFPWTALPVLLDALIVAAFMLGVGTLVMTTFINPPTLHNIAQILESRRNKKHQLLSIALELGEKTSHTSEALVEKVCADAATSLPQYPKAIRNTIKKERVYVLGVTIVIFTATIFLAKPSIFAWWDIPFAMFASVGAKISPGKLVVPEGTRITLSCFPDKAAYPSAKLTKTELSQSGARSTGYLLRPDSAGNFSYTTDSLKKTLAYTFTLGNQVFGPETVTVVPPPIIYSLKVKLHPPGYTRKPAVRLPEGQGAIPAYAGTTAEFYISSLFPLKMASYIHEMGDTIPLTISDGKASGEIQLWRSGSYTFTLEDSMSQKSDSLPSFYITLLPDYEPLVRILKPGVNKILTEEPRETLWVEAADDFGIRQLALEWKLSNDEIDTVYRKNILPAGVRKKLIRVNVVWNIAELSLYPGDSVFYWVKTRDNKPFGKIQLSYSDTFFFRLPSFEEFHKRITQKEDEAEKAMSSVQKMQKNMKERLETLMKSAKGKESLSWEEKKIVEDLDKSMREQTDSLNKAIEALQEAVEKIKESSMNDEILDRMSEVQKALKEIIEEYGDSLIFRKDHDEKIGWKDLKNSVEKMAEILPDIKEHLDNALKYLEMLKKENERAILAEQAKKLAQEQMQLAQSKEGDNKKFPVQQDLTKRTKDFLNDTKGKLSGDKDSPVGMKDIPSIKQVSSLQQTMQSSLSKQQMPDNNAMHQMSASLQSLSEELESTLSSNLYAKTMQDRERLLNMAQDAMNLSQWQRNLAQSIGPDIDKKLTALEQQALRDALLKSMSNLDSLEVVPPSMIQGILQKKDKALSSMNQALQQLSNQRGKSGMRGSTVSLNDLASSLLSSADQLTKSCSGGGQGGMGSMMGGLQKLSAKQAAINSATSELLRQMLAQSGKQSGGTQGSSSQGQGSMQGADAENARKAAQRAQKALADQLRDLAEKYGEGSEKGLKKRVKELEEEARRIAKMLENPTPQVADRQDRFLVRMLQTTLSLHKQDEGKEERESKSATVIFSNNAVPVDKATFNKTDTFYNLRMKALDGNFPDSYRRQVQAYFDSLSVLFLRGK